MLNETNTVIPFQLGDNQVRGSIVRLGTTVSNIIKRHNYPKVIESFLADALSLTACIGSRMKHKGIFTLQAKGNGEVHTLFSDITNDGFLRGYAGFETECLNCENDLFVCYRESDRKDIMLGDMYLHKKIDAKLGILINQILQFV